eukprot:80312_1
MDQDVIRQMGFRILLHELHRYYPNNEQYREFESMPRYISILVRNHFSNITKIQRNPSMMLSESLHHIIHSLLFCDNGCISLDVVIMIFPHLEHIFLGDCRKCDKFAGNVLVYAFILDVLRKNEHCNLKSFGIRFTGSKKLKSQVDNIIVMFGSKFKQIGWNMWSYGSKSPSKFFELWIHTQDTHAPHKERKISNVGLIRTRQRPLSHKHQQ